MKSSIKLLVFLSVLVCFSLQSAYAQTPALEFGSLGTGTDYYQGQSYSLGWKFTAKQNITVSALGFYDDKKDGLKESHAVGIYDAATCELVASTTVSPSDPLTGFFRYKGILPVSLTAGRDYYAAAVTGTEKYAIAVSTMVPNAAINYIGFSIFGGTQPSTSLKCPNGSQSPGFKGDYGPNFLIGGTGVLPTPTVSPDDLNKRPTAITIFCNRTGVNLETAKCSATVADAGPPPRSLPTGVINFTATDGFFPASAQCFIQQTPFSPGIGSCEAQFAIPFGFPIGVRFPIDVEYPGDANFRSSSTSHATIEVGCIGDEKNPCPGSVFLTFGDIPQILQNILSTVFECGPIILPAITERAGGNQTGSCEGTVDAEAELATILAQLSPEQWQTVANSISRSAAEQNAITKAVRNIGKYAPPQLNQILNDALKINAELLKQLGNIPKPAIARRNLAYSVSAAKAKRMVMLKLGSNKISTKQNTVKAVKVKVPKATAKITGALKKAGVDTIDANLTIKGKRKGVKKSNFSNTQSVTLGLN